MREVWLWERTDGRLVGGWFCTKEAAEAWHLAIMPNGNPRCRGRTVCAKVEGTS